MSAEGMRSVRSLKAAAIMLDIDVDIDLLAAVALRIDEATYEVQR